MQIRRSEVVYLSQDSMMSSSRVNCTGTHLRERTLLIRKLGRSDPTNDAEKGTAPTQYRGAVPDLITDRMDKSRRQKADAEKSTRRAASPPATSRSSPRASGRPGSWPRRGSRPRCLSCVEKRK